MKISWIIQSNILTSSANSSARGSDWREQLRRPCLLSKTKRTGSVFLWSLLRGHLLFVFPFTHSNLPAALPCVKVSFNPEEEAEHAFTVGMFGASACMAVRAGIMRWTAAKVISCLPHPLFPASCWQGTHSRGINEISRLLLPLPYVNLSPFLSGRQPCRPSVANPAQAGLGRTIDTHTLKYFAVCALFSVLRECVAHVCSLGSEVEAANLSRGHPGRNDRRKAFVIAASEFVPLSHPSPAHPHLPSTGSQELGVHFSHVPPSARLFPWMKPLAFVLQWL